MKTDAFVALLESARDLLNRARNIAVADVDYDRAELARNLRCEVENGVDSCLQGAKRKAAPLPLPESEDECWMHARRAQSQTDWTIGAMAHAWLSKWGRGRTLADFGRLTGHPEEFVRHRYEVFQRFSAMRDKLPRLLFAHFSAAMKWGNDDAIVCLEWADDMDASVAEMKAWRRAQHGEDLSIPVEDL